MCVGGECVEVCVRECVGVCLWCFGCVCVCAGEKARVQGVLCQYHALALGPHFNLSRDVNKITQK